MGLLAVQRELAAILLEPAARRAFKADRRLYLAQRGLTAADRRVLAGLDADDVAYFAQRRDIDRHQALRADAPRSVRLLEAAHGRPKAYFRDHPYAHEDPRAEAQAFARWCRGAARDGLVPALLPDVAAFEAAALRLYASPFRAPHRSPHPRRAPGVRLLALGHRLGPFLRSGDPGRAVPGKAWVALVRTADDVRWVGLDRLEAALLRSASGRLPRAAWLRQAHGHPAAGARAAAARLLDEGLLRPARR